MKIPDSIRINGVEYEITHIPNLRLNDALCYGYISYNEAQINLSTTDGTEHQRQCQAPTADVAEVKHGEWKHYPECSSGIVEVDECSECGDNYVFGDLYKYCPNCGAIMDGGVNNG